MMNGRSEWMRVKQTIGRTLFAALIAWSMAVRAVATNAVAQTTRGDESDSQSSQSSRNASPESYARLIEHDADVVKVVCFGDSVTGVYYHTGGRRAYADMLAIALRRMYPSAAVTVINAGVSGHDTRDALARIDRDVLAYRPQLVTVMFGLNDMTRVPLAEYKSNLSRIVDQCRGAGAAVLLCAPNAVIDTPGRPSATLETYVAAMREVGAELDVPVLDCYAAFQQIRAENPLAYSLLMSDEIHPNMDGHKFLAELLAQRIGGALVSLADVGPPAPAIPRALALLKAGAAVKVYAMPPYDTLIGPALRATLPDADVEATRWEVEGRSLDQIAQEAKQVRSLRMDLVIVAVPTEANADTTENYARLYSALLNQSLSFAHQEWDCIAIPASVANPAMSDDERSRDELVKQLIRAQDLGTVARADNGETAESLLTEWIHEQADDVATSTADVSPGSVWAPEITGPRQGGVILLPDGSMKRFVTKGLGDNVYHNFSERSVDGGRTWSDPEFAYEGPPAALPLLDAAGEYHLFPMLARREGEGRTIAVDYFIDIWHLRSREGGTVWEAPKVIFEGYVGSINNVLQLSSGRIVLPFAAWVGGRPQGPPMGANEITCLISDDGGSTWRQSASRLTAPCYTDFNGSGYGACEPVLLELQDKSVYMLARTETGRLYESHSADGDTWEPLRPAPFLSTDAPAGLLRLTDGRILLFWNGCEKPPRVDGAGVYGGRDALHAAISADEGRTWYGYREVYRDPTRNDSPPASGDRGTAYPMPYHAPFGKVIVMAGQGRAGATVLFDPDWLLETHQKDDFSNGLDGWSVFKHFGPAKGWWRDRVQGPELIENPDGAGPRVLHVRRADEKPGDGAVWNFPIGRKGDLKIRVRLQPGFGGAAISLLDRFFNPTDTTAESEASFVLPIQPDGHISLANQLEADRWYILRFEWDLPKRSCVVSIDGEPTLYLKPSYREVPGLNYLRIRSTAEKLDPAGLLIDSVEVDILP